MSSILTRREWDEIKEGFQQRISEWIQQALKRPTYGFVYSLIINWEEGIEDFKRESAELGRYLETRGHVVIYFKIPRDTPHAHLSSFISGAILKVNQRMEKEKCPAAIWLHYGGHGDKKDEAVWAEQAINGPTVNWYTIQETLRDAKCDLLLLLDCCFALRASQRLLTPNTGMDSAASFHLLAAASHRDVTPMPGPGSHTNALLRVLKEHFPMNNSSCNDWLTVTQLFREIKQIRSPPLQTQPCNHPFTDGTIWIGPVKKVSEEAVVPDSTDDRNIVTLRLTLQNDIHQSQLYALIVHLIRYLTLDRPQFIENVELLNSNMAAARTLETEITSSTENTHQVIPESKLQQHGGIRDSLSQKRVEGEQGTTLESGLMEDNTTVVRNLRIPPVSRGYVMIPAGLAIAGFLFVILLFVCIGIIAVKYKSAMSEKASLVCQHG